MNEDEDFEFDLYAGMVCLRVPNTRARMGVRWLEFVISTDCARRLRDELDIAIKEIRNLRETNPAR